MQHLQAGHPAAKMLVELSKSQDIVAGDGTTSVVILAGAFLEVSSNIHVAALHTPIANSKRMPHGCSYISSLPHLLPCITYNRPNIYASAGTGVPRAAVERHPSHANQRGAAGCGGDHPQVKRECHNLCKITLETTMKMMTKCKSKNILTKMLQGFYRDHGHPIGLC